MKTLSTKFLLLLCLLIFSGNNLSRANAQTKPTVVRAVQSVTIIATVTADEKRVITNDKKIWTVANPAALKGHAWQRVSIIGKTGANDTITAQSIQVLTPKYPCCP